MQLLLELQEALERQLLVEVGPEEVVTQCRADFLQRAARRGVIAVTLTHRRARTRNLAHLSAGKQV